MKSKNSKKLSLAKETLKTLNTSHLALVQGASNSIDDTVYCVEPAMLGTSSNSL